MGSLENTVQLLSLFSDPTRLRLLALLSHEELSVVELTRITELPQSRVSTHLGRLKEAGLLRDRRFGASTFYALSEAGLPERAEQLWKHLSSQLADRVLEADRERCRELVRAREAAADWPDSIAGQLERYYSPGRTWEATARGLVGLLGLGDVLDIGAGDGAISELLIPNAASVTLLDRSQKMVSAAKKRLGHIPSVHFHQADMHELPFEAARFDQVLLYHCLTYSNDPERVLGEASRVLRPGGRLAVVTLSEHNHMHITSAYSHVNAGFSPRLLRGLIEARALHVRSCEVTSRERKPPYFEVVSAFGVK